MKIDQLIGKVNKLLPSLAILPELRKLLKSSESSIDDIVKLVNTDNALVAQVVRISNSPYYGGDGQCANVDDAIARIGFHEVYKIIAVLLANPVISMKNCIYEIDPEEAWRNSMFCAVTMQHLGQALKIDPDTAYTAGLLHTIGKSAISSYYNNESAEEVEKVKGKMDTFDEERKLIGFDHADVGAALLTKWNFSEDVTIPIKQQFSPAAGGRYLQTAYALSVAKMLVPHLGQEPANVLRMSGVDSFDLDGIGLDEFEIMECIEKISGAVAEIDQLIAA